MNIEITKQQACILLISGVEIWIDKERGDELQTLLQGIKENKFIRIDDKTINTSSISAIVSPSDMESKNRRKNGQWICKVGEWHDKGQTCNHKSKEKEQAEREFYKQNGFYPL